MNTYQVCHRLNDITRGGLLLRTISLTKLLLDYTASRLLLLILTDLLLLLLILLLRVMLLLLLLLLLLSILMLLIHLLQMCL